jgi:hypothetical protein
MFLKRHHIGMLLEHLFPLWLRVFVRYTLLKNLAKILFKILQNCKSCKILSRTLQDSYQDSCEIFSKSLARIFHKSCKIFQEPYTYSVQCNMIPDSWIIFQVVAWILAKSCFDSDLIPSKYFLSLGFKYVGEINLTWNYQKYKSSFIISKGM